MSETLIIRNFGPIKEVKLDLKKFNVIIGENATGKSTIAKLLAVCRYFSFIKGTNFIDHQNRSVFSGGLISWGIAEYININSYIYYECKDYSLKVIHENFEGNPHPVTTFVPTLKPISKEFSNLLSELEKIMPPGSNTDNTTLMWTAPNSFFQNNVAKVMDNPFYLPTERGLQSIFSLGKNSIANISDSLFNQLANLDLIARNFKGVTSIEPLGISYLNKDGKGYVRKDSETEFYSLSNGASGFQSTIPVVLVVKYYKELTRKRKTFLIEEPELNLFPKAQKELINFLVANTVNQGSKVLITTHSPYILTSLNNLMFAYQTGQSNREDIDKIIDKKYWVNPADVSAYMMSPNGECKSIIDREGLIKTEKIDNISQILNKEFNEMFDIELAIKK